MREFKAVVKTVHAQYYDYGDGGGGEGGGGGARQWSFSPCIYCVYYARHARLRNIAPLHGHNVHESGEEDGDHGEPRVHLPHMHASVVGNVDR